MSATLQWWAPALQAALSQGDVVSGLSVGTFVFPFEYLAPHLLKKGQKGWKSVDQPTESKQTQRVHVLGAVLSQTGLVVSHSCDLDKPQTEFVLVAPVAELSKLPVEHRGNVMEQQTKSLMPLPGLPGLGDCFADLRLISAVPRKSVALDQRIASMTDQATSRLHGQLSQFLLRRKMPP